MVDVSVITDVNNILTILTVTVIPAFLGLGTGVINFIQHHTNRADIKAGAQKDAEYIQKFADLDKKISEHISDISAGTGVASEMYPALKEFITKHQAQIDQINATQQQLAAEVAKIKSLIPAN